VAEEELLPPGELDDPPPPTGDDTAPAPAPGPAPGPRPPRPDREGADTRPGVDGDSDRRPDRPRLRDRRDRDGEDERPDDDRRRPPHGHDRGGLSEADLDRALEVLKKIHPDIATRVERVREQDPERAAELLRRSFPRLRQLLMLQRIDPEMFDLKVEDLRLGRVTRFYAAAVRQARDQGHDSLVEQRRATLKRLVARHYDVRLEIRQVELRRLEQRIEALRGAMADEQARRDAVIARQVARLAGDDDPPATRPSAD